MKYSTDFDKEKCASVYGRDLHVSPKHAREVCKEIVEMSTASAEKYLEEVIALKRAVPYTRFNNEFGHKRGMASGRYPVKASGKVLDLLREAVANAEFKGLDSEKLVIKHASAYPGRRIKRYMPRAQGRSGEHSEITANIELVVEETE
jgi:large subunit ribosomal protein L22